MQVKPEESESILFSTYGSGGHDEPGKQPPLLMQSSANDMDVDGKPTLNVLERRQHSSSVARPTHESSITGDDGRFSACDDLSYLDAVKSQFPVNSSVYNRFLDTMRDFKNQRCADSFHFAF